MQDNISHAKSITRSKKYEALLATARELFWKHGFKRVSIEEIAEKAGVSKMTFYRFFPNKLEVAKAVYDKEMHHGIVAFRNVLFSTSDSPEQKVRKLIAMKFEGTHAISREFLMDFYNNPELGLKDHIERMTTEAWKEVIRDLKKAQKLGIFRKDFKPELFFAFSESVTHLLSNKALLDLYDSPQKLIMEVVDLMIYGILPKNR